MGTKFLSLISNVLTKRLSLIFLGAQKRVMVNREAIPTETLLRKDITRAQKAHVLLKIRCEGSTGLALCGSPFSLPF